MNPSPPPPVEGVIAILATLDTKGEEARFVADRIRSAGAEPVVIDTAPSSGGRRADGGDKQSLMTAAADRAIAALRELLDAGRLSGVVGMGGGQGTWIAATAMRSLPLGVPKVLVTTIVGRASVHVRESDIVVIPSVTDIAGLNAVLRPILAGAAETVVGIARARREYAGDDAPLTGMTMFGVTTAGGDVLRHRLEHDGHQVAVFHANGLGGRNLESLIDAGRIEGLVDWTITELADEVVGGIATAGPHRLEAASRRGIPQLVVPGALDVVNFGERSTVPERFHDRVFSQHTPAATLMRTDASEMRTIGRLVGAKLAGAERGSVAVLIPTRGFSALSAPGGPFEDPAADAAFVEALRAEAPGLEVQELDRNINDPDFAESAGSLYEELRRNRTLNRS